MRKVDGGTSLWLTNRRGTPVDLVEVGLAKIAVFAEDLEVRFNQRKFWPFGARLDVIDVHGDAIGGGSTTTLAAATTLL